LLDAHGLAGVGEEPLLHSGFSGATLTRLTRADGARFVLKRTGISRDWIMRSTDDDRLREASISNDVLPPVIRSPLLGQAPDEDGRALLMHDISEFLLPPGIVDDQSIELILQHMAECHAAKPPAGVPWCDLTRRITLLTPVRAEIARSYGAPVADDLVNGWNLFERLAPSRAVELIQALIADPGPLVRALSGERSAFLHGDLKFDNIGVSSNGTLWLIDWALTLLAPPAVELGWFLAINSRRMGMSLDQVMRSYAGYAAIAGAEQERHDALTVLCGLLLRGWRKALDADAGEPGELRWWCERAVEAAELLR
jgi:hypothetical protein